MHQPRHLSESARLFGPDYLEVFTKTNWYTVPIVWLPIAFYLFLRSARQFDAPLPPVTLSTFPSSFPTVQEIQSVSTHAWTLTLACFFLGNIVWTLLEYGFHRFLFHIDRLLPDRPSFLTLHFLMHGIHHYLPMDKYVALLELHVQLHFGTDLTGL